MKQKDFTYAVARIRSKELGLLNAQHMEQLIGCKSFEEALHFLADRGWGSPDEPLEAERLLEGEMDRTWQTVEAMVDDKTVFDTLRVADDFHNLKAAIKQLYTGSRLPPERLYVKGGRLDGEKVRKAVGL